MTSNRPARLCAAASNLADQTNMMAPPRGFGLYVHIPYCTSICPYCDFNAYVVPKAAPWAALTASLLRELNTRASLFAGPLRSVYFGGGTPSLAPASLVAAVLDAAQAQFGLVDGAEVTLEANPGTTTLQGLAAFRRAGVNRLSLGWQSTHAPLLRVLGRQHTAQDGHLAIEHARAAGFDVVSLDLIFAVPGQTQAQLRADLAHIAALQPEHVSLYAMTIEPGTPFARRQARGTLVPAPDELQLAMMQQIDLALAAAGYEHYEISNYARPGRRAVHNSLYWQGGEYLGIGPGAHSFCHDSWRRGWRWEATRQPPAYLVAWQRGCPSPGLPPIGAAPEATASPADLDAAAVDRATVQFCEALTAEQLRCERMLCGMRHVDGVRLDTASPMHDGHVHGSPAEQAIHHGWATLREGSLRPTALGWQHADSLAALFF